MNLSNLSKKILEFALNRIIDILGIFVIIVSIFLLLSLISYSPDDPNFIFQKIQILIIYLVFMEVLHQIYFFNHLV